MTDSFTLNQPRSSNSRGRLARSVVHLISVAACSVAVLACTFYARSPDQYRDETSNLLATKSAELNTCYDNAAQATPGLSGKVAVKFTVEKKTGKIINITSDPARTTAPQPLIDCVVNSINGLVLTPPDQRNGDATFEYDFARPVPPAHT